VRLMLAPASEVLLHDTWHVAGLRGTGSHDIEFRAVRVPKEHSASVFADRPVQSGPLYAFPLFGLLAVAIAGTALGIARGALDELVELAQRKRPSGGQRRLAERPTIQSDLAQAEASLRAARLLLLDSVDRAWEQAAASGEVSVPGRAALRLAATHATATAAEVTNVVFRLAGASAIYETSALQRRFRDVNVATQHMLVAPATWELTGRLLMDVETDVTQL
jgi:indole-3-acetate monooxygenase